MALLHTFDPAPTERYTTIGSKPAPSATCPRESVLPIRLRPDFLLFSRVMQERLSTGAAARRPGNGQPTLRQCMT